MAIESLRNRHYVKCRRQKAGHIMIVSALQKSGVQITHRDYCHTLTEWMATHSYEQTSSEIIRDGGKCFAFFDLTTHGTYGVLKSEVHREGYSTRTSYWYLTDLAEGCTARDIVTSIYDGCVNVYVY